MFSPSPECLLRAVRFRNREGPNTGGRIVKWPLSKQEKAALKFTFFWISRNCDVVGVLEVGVLENPIGTRRSGYMLETRANYMRVWSLGARPTWYTVPHTLVCAVKPKEMCHCW